MPREKNAGGVAAVFRDMYMHPDKSLRGILDKSGVAHGGIKAVIHDRRDAATGREALPREFVQRPLPRIPRAAGVKHHGAGGIRRVSGI